MDIALSENEIVSFVGNVLPLCLLGTEPYGNDPITWDLEGDCVHLQRFSEDVPPRNEQDTGFFTDGVLLTLLKAGKAKVTAHFESKSYTCSITIRETPPVRADDPMDHYVGDLHVHTWNNHKREAFTARQAEHYPRICLQQLVREGKLDFAAISDHADLLDRREYFRGFVDAQIAQGSGLIVLPGCESEVTVVEKDRYGIPHKNSGEVVALNANACASASSWESFLSTYADSPFGVCTFAHPMIVGYSVKGVWNFSFSKSSSRPMRRMMKLLETGDGSDRNSNLIHEYAYSDALDSGFRVCPTCSSDNHGPQWGYDRFPGKTVIMAKEKSKEAFLDAIRHNRVYATSSGNVKLRYCVNGCAAPADLPLTDKYRFHIDVSYFHRDPTTQIVGGQVISDGGVPVKAFDCADISEIDFEVTSKTAAWFYLRLWDAEGRKTWSVPVWTGRTPHREDVSKLIPLDKAGFTATDQFSGEDAGGLMQDDPTQFWTSQKTTCSIVIDMHGERTVAGLGHYPRIITRDQLTEGATIPMLVAQYPSRFVISTSSDGQHFTQQAQGQFRVFGGEEVIPFPEHKARYLRLEVLSTCGRDSRRAAFADARVAMAELTPYTAKG